MTNVMNYIINNWELIVTCIFVLILAGQKIVEFVSLPTDKKIAEVKARLLIWVTDAQNDLGTGTNQIKLSKVYDKFCTEFPYLKKWISLDKFDDYVKEALVKMKKILATKDTVASVAVSEPVSIPATIDINTEINATVQSTGDIKAV